MTRLKHSGTTHKTNSDTVCLQEGNKAWRTQVLLHFGHAHGKGESAVVVTRVDLREFQFEKLVCTNIG
jgi:hypothetical protein